MFKSINKVISCSKNIVIQLYKNELNFNYLCILGKYGFVRIYFNKKLINSLLSFQTTWNPYTININKIKLKLKKITKWQSFYTLLELAFKTVSHGFTIQLEVHGLGFKVYIYKAYLLILLGKSHGFRYKLTNNIDIICVKSTLISLFGIDKNKLSQFAASLRALCIPEPYNGKGIRYLNEHIIRKEGKKK